MLHVVWDWNGTLLVDQPMVLAAVNAALDAVGAQPTTMADYRRVPKRPVKPFYERIAGRSLSDAEWHVIDETYHVAYAARVSEAPLAPDAVEALRRTTSAGASQSLLSMWPHDDLVPLVREHGISESFSRIDGYRGECGGEKAEHLAEHVEALAADLGLRPDQLVVVGDTVDDAVAARLCGTRALLLESDTYDRDILDRQGVPVATSLLGALDLLGVPGTETAAVEVAS